MIKRHRILFVSPEVLFIPQQGYPNAPFISSQAAGPSQYLAYLISDLYYLGADVHLVQPAYRRVFEASNPERSGVCTDMPAARIHLAQDRIFYYADGPDSIRQWQDIGIAITLQREVLHRWIPEIQPDLIHCHDWMCGLLPAAVKKLGIPTIFNFGRMETRMVSIGLIEEYGIDVAQFWDSLFYARMPLGYEESRDLNPIDMLLSGLWAATTINAIGMEAIQALSVGSRVPTPFHHLLQAQPDKKVARIGEGTFSTEDYVHLFEQTLGLSLTGGETQRVTCDIKTHPKIKRFKNPAKHKIRQVWPAVQRRLVSHAV